MSSILKIALITFLFLGRAQAQVDECEELSKKVLPLVTCTDQGHKFDKIVATYQIAPISECTSMATSEITITYADDSKKEYMGDEFSLFQLERFRKSTKVSMALIGYPRPLKIDDEGTVEGGVVLKLIRRFDDVKPYVEGTLSINGRVYTELTCSEEQK